MEPFMPTKIRFYFKQTLKGVLLCFLFSFSIFSIVFAQTATFKVRSCLKIPNICDTSQYKTCQDIGASVKLTYVDQYGNTVTTTGNTELTVVGFKDATKSIRIEFLGKEGYVFHSWGQLDELGNSACGYGGTSYVDTQALSRTFVEKLQQLPLHPVRKKVINAPLTAIVVLV